MHEADRFIRYLKFEKRYSEHTLTAYRKDLAQFFDFAVKTYEAERPGDITYMFVRSWVVHLMDRGLKPRTVNRKISTLKSFFGFLLREKRITTDPMVRVVGPKAGKNLPVVVRATQMETLLNHDAFPDDFSGMRDRCIIETLYGTGMRRAELCGLKLDDLDTRQRTVRVLGKRNKERIVPLGPSLAKLLGRYLKERKSFMQDAGINAEYLFLEKSGPVRPEKVYGIVKKYLSLVSTDKKRSPHLLRHTFATHMLDNGADINAIKELLGHASLAATQVYTHNSAEKLKKAYKQAHPHS